MFLMDAEALSAFVGGLGLKLLPWQVQVLDQLLERDEDGNYRIRKATR